MRVPYNFMRNKAVSNTFWQDTDLAGLFSLSNIRQPFSIVFKHPEAYSSPNELIDDLHLQFHYSNIIPSQFCPVL